MIDVHQHVLPPEYVKALESRGIMPKGNVPWPKWNPELALETMERNGIDKGVFFVSEPGTDFNDREWGRYLARMVNEYCAATIEKHPDKFGNFALLPLPYLDDAMAELEYALDTLKLDGIALLTNYSGKYLGDPEFDELFAELNRRNAIVFIHPTSPLPEQISKVKLPGYCLEFVFDTTRSVANLLISGTLEKNPNLKIICAHAGGTIPYLAQRFEYTRVRSNQQFPEFEPNTPKGVSRYLQNLYYDTGLSYSDTTLGFLEKFVGFQQILFGSDWPFAPERWMTENVEAVKCHFKSNGKMLAAVSGGNAIELLNSVKK